MSSTERFLEWVEVKRKKPRLTKVQRQSNAFGKQVLIWPPYEMYGFNPAHVAFYGCRVTDKPDFYLYGRLIPVNYWMELPIGPTAVDKSDG